MKKILILTVCFLASFCIAASSTCSLCTEAYNQDNPPDCAEPVENGGVHTCTEDKQWDKVIEGKCSDSTNVSDTCEDEGVTTDIVYYEWDCELEVKDSGGSTTYSCVAKKTGGSKTKSAVKDCST